MAVPGITRMLGRSPIQGLGEFKSKSVVFKYHYAYQNC